MFPGVWIRFPFEGPGNITGLSVPVECAQKLCEPIVAKVGSGAASIVHSQQLSGYQRSFAAAPARICSDVTIEGELASRSFADGKRKCFSVVPTGKRPLRWINLEVTNRVYSCAFRWSARRPLTQGRNRGTKSGLVENEAALRVLTQGSTWDESVRDSQHSQSCSE